MDKSKKITILGGDKRYMFLSRMFSENGYRCLHTHGKNIRDINDADIIVLPIPSFDSDGNITGTNYTVYDLFTSLKENSIIFAAKAPSVIRSLAREYKVKMFDYLDSEDFNILNAIPSAEGAVLTYLQKTNKVISNSSFTVLGYGKIGKALCCRLKALGAEVYAGARSKAARLNAENDNIKSLTISEAIKNAQYSDAVFNTVPAPIIDEKNIIDLKDTLIIDLASIPGALNEKAKIAAGENFIHALSLPGKYFPYTAGEIIYKTILGILGGEETDI